MQALQRSLQMIARQFRDLSSTAKLLIGSIMIILVMSLFLVSLYAGGHTMAPLGLGANMTADARARAISFLENRSIAYQIKGSDVLVPADQKYTVLAQLTEGHLIDADQINFETLMKDVSPFLTRDQSRQRYLVAKMNVLGNMISQMNGIQRATVVLDQPEGAAGLGASHIPASASVSVLTRGGELSQTQADAIAQTVAGAHAGLKQQNVKIIDARTGRAMQARSDDVLSAGKYLDVKLAAEHHAKDTLQGALNYIPGVLIEVNAQVDTKETVQQTSKLGEPKQGLLSEKVNTRTSTNAASGNEPGVQPNTGVALASSGRQGSQMSDESSQTSSIPLVDKTETQTRDNKGYALQINASIGVPKSYFIRLFQNSTKGDATAQPDPAVLDALVLSETEKIKSYITPLIDTKAIEGATAGTVAVTMVSDFGAGAFVGNTNATVEGASVAGGVAGGGGSATDGLVKYISLGGLAVISLAMMFMMVRKASVREEMPSASEMVGIPPALAAAESDLVGEADEASPALEGLELNDDAIRRSQMLDQITEMVSNTPEDAANLLRRWMRAEA